jgi:hypothetical protein
VSADERRHCSGNKWDYTDKDICIILPMGYDKHFKVTDPKEFREHATFIDSNK